MEKEQIIIDIITHGEKIGSVQKIEGETITVSENGHTIFSQYKDMYMLKSRQKTFVDIFLSCLQSNEAPDNTSGDTCNIVCNGGDLLYFVSKRRLQSLNLKQKFFHFLLKHIFLHGKTATVENIKSLCIDFDTDSWTCPSQTKPTD